VPKVKNLTTENRAQRTSKGRCKGLTQRTKRTRRKSKIFPTEAQESQRRDKRQERSKPHTADGIHGQWNPLRSKVRERRPEDVHEHVGGELVSCRWGNGRNRLSYDARLVAAAENFVHAGPSPASLDRPVVTRFERGARRL